MFELTFNPAWSVIFLKIIFVLGSLFYLFYSFVVVRQIAVMKKTLITGFSDMVTLFGLINLILATVVLLAFILLL